MKVMEFKDDLMKKERSAATIEKYIRDVRGFLEFIAGEVTHEEVLRYKEYLCGRYAMRSVNSMLSAVNEYLKFIGEGEKCAKLVRVQRRTFEESEEHLTREEYERLLSAARESGRERLFLLMQAICSTGIRVSEVKFITIEAVRSEKVDISLKGKRRKIVIPKKLCRALLKYAAKKGIRTGCIFVTRTGKPMDRRNIWLEMKKLCEKAKVSEKKVFPHNLRHLFARVYYQKSKDVVRLADILGHSSIETTRIYTMETSEQQRKRIEELNLLLC